MIDIHMLVCSDLHSSENALEMISKLARSGEFDLVVVCGDFTTVGTTEYVKRFLKGTGEVMVLAVPGNCDLPETVEVLEKAHASVHNRRTQFGGWDFYGFGGGVTTSSGMPFENDERLIEESLRKVAVPGGVMVTHTPPYGMNDLGRAGNHGGSEGILRVVKEFKPRLVLSGHMHESQGTRTTEGTVFVNPGSARLGAYASVLLGPSIKTKLYHG
ncbi:MAG: metallophosphoesterase [Thermoplasmata archaeon]